MTVNQVFAGPSSDACLRANISSSHSGLSEAEVMAVFVLWATVPFPDCVWTLRPSVTCTGLVSRVCPGSPRAPGVFLPVKRHRWVDWWSISWYEYRCVRKWTRAHRCTRAGARVHATSSTLLDDDDRSGSSTIARDAALVRHRSRCRRLRRPHRSATALFDMRGARAYCARGVR